MGDHKNYGMTEGEYRTAKKLLAKRWICNVQINGHWNRCKSFRFKGFSTPQNFELTGKLTDA